VDNNDARTFFVSPVKFGLIWFNAHTRFCTDADDLLLVSVTVTVKVQN